MFPDSQYAHPEGSFRNPVQPVNVDPNSDPTVQICINKRWIPYIVGSLKQLLLQSTWKTSDPGELNTIQGRVFDLIGLFASAGECINFDNIPLYEEFTDMVAFREDCECNLYYKCCDGSEKKIAIIADVPANSTTSGGEPTPPSGGGIQDYCKSFNANSVSLIPGTVSTGDVITITSADGSGYDGVGVTWYCPTGDVLFVSCQAGTGHLDSGDPLPSHKHMSLIIKIGSSYYPIAVGSPLTVPGGVSAAQVWIQVNDSNLVDNFGSYQVCYSVKNNQVGSWSKVFDLTTNSYGLYLVSADTTGAWISGQGWQTTFIQLSNGYRAVDLYFNVPSVLNLTDIKVEFTYTPGTLASSGDNTFSIYYDAVGTPLIHYITPTVPTSPQEYSLPVTVTTRLLITLMAGVVTGTGDPGGVGTLTKIILSGTGTNPF